MTAEFACGQILFNLRNSNLHYLLKETHLSAYITIRKKFIKEEPVEVSSNAEEYVDVSNVKKLEDKIRKEN